MFNNVQVGVHNQIAGTIAELVAPAGFEYSGMMGNMFAHNVVWNYKLYASKKKLGSIGKNVELTSKASDLKKIAAWRVAKGNNL